MTIAAWLGHKDEEILVGKVYGICWMNTAKRQRSSSGSKGKPLG